MAPKLIIKKFISLGESECRSPYVVSVYPVGIYAYTNNTTSVS